MPLFVALLSFLGGFVTAIFLEIQGIRSVLEPVREALRFVFPDA